MAKQTRGNSPREFMLADLKRSALTPADASKMKCRAADTEDGERLYEIPYFGLDGAERDFRRQRFEWGKPKYLQPKDKPPQLYFCPLLKGGWKKIAAKPVDVWIGEGEKTSAAACKIGIPCIGIGGIRSWTKKGSDKLIVDFNLLPWEGRNVYLCPDSDYNTNGDIRKATFGLAAKLRERGAHVFRVVLPNELNGKPGKVGLDDFIAVHGRTALKAVKELLTNFRTRQLAVHGRTALKAVKELLTNEITEHGSYPPLERYCYTAPEFDALKIPEREELIRGVLEEQSMMMVFGPTGVGKSWFAMELCRALAAGVQFLAWPVARKCKVLLVDGETTMPTLHHRMRLLKINSLPNFNLLPSEPLYRDGCPLNLHEDAHQERIYKYLNLLDAQKKSTNILIY